MLPWALEWAEVPQVFRLHTLPDPSIKASISLSALFFGGVWVRSFSFFKVLLLKKYAYFLKFENGEE